MIGHDDYNKYIDKYYQNYKISRNDDDNNIISATDIRLIVKSTTDSLASIKVKTLANGSSYELARERAQNINYSYEIINNELRLNAYLTTDVSYKFSDQNVEVILYLPEGSILYADDNTHKFHQNNSYVNDILKTGMEEHYLKIIEDDVQCLDCTEAKSEESRTIEISEEKEETIKDDKPNVSIKINEEDGVNIEVNDN